MTCSPVHGFRYEYLIEPGYKKIGNGMEKQLTKAISKLNNLLNSKDKIPKKVKVLIKTNELRPKIVELIKDLEEVKRSAIHLEEIATTASHMHGEVFVDRDIGSDLKNWSKELKTIMEQMIKSDIAGLVARFSGINDCIEAQTLNTQKAQRLAGKANHLLDNITDAISDLRDLFMKLQTDLDHLIGTQSS